MRVILLILSLVVSLNVSATDTGNVLLADCAEVMEPRSDKNINILNASVCVSFIHGMRIATDIHQHQLKVSLFCTPHKVSAMQTVRIVYKYLQEHPEKLHESKNWLVLYALEEAFPCNK